MARSEARIVLLGRPVKGANKFKGDLLADINPTEIPKEFIEKIDITFSSGQVVEFKKQRIKKNFTMEEMSEFLKHFDAKGAVKLVEITLDIEKIYQSLQEGSDHLFGKFFK